jgi:hypothetical protein
MSSTAPVSRLTDMTAVIARQYARDTGRALDQAGILITTPGANSLVFMISYPVLLAG